MQGPKAADVLATLSPTVAAMRFMDAGPHTVAGIDCFVSRSGYTGEDGYEISIPADRAADIAQALLAHADVLPVGLGARDSLRLEAGLCLYGNDIDETTTPVEAAIEWSMQKARRTGGARAGGFPGAEIVLNAIAERRDAAACRPQARGPRAGARRRAAVMPIRIETQSIGSVNSGGFGPSVNAPVAMGYVPTAFAATGTLLFAEVRGQRLPMHVTDLPFVPHSYKR